MLGASYRIIFFAADVCGDIGPFATHTETTLVVSALLCSEVLMNQKLDPLSFQTTRIE
jgi:hypothetical protein